MATELERRWNERLAEVARLEEQIRTAQEMQLGLGISEAERTELMALADDLPRAAGIGSRTSPINCVGLSSKQTTGRLGSVSSA